MFKSSTTRLIVTFFALIFISACGSGGSGDSGSLVAPPVPITFGQFVDGDLDTFREEIFTFSVPAGTYISVELYGIRLGQADWNPPAPFNAPNISIYDNSIGTGLEILRHDVNDLTWFFGHRDMEIPLYYLPDAGDYSLRIRRSETAAAGGPYKLRLNDVTSGIQARFGTAREEAFDFSNDINSPEPLGAGDTEQIVTGRLTDNDVDFFSYDIFTIDGKPLITCFEVFAQRNGMLAAPNTEYQDLELTLYQPDINTPANPDIKVNVVDDAFFLDPRLCRKVTALTTEEYKISVNETTAADPTASVDYLLTYTVETPAENIVAEPPPATDTYTAATPINTGELVVGEITDAADEDWFTFTANRGDMVRIRQFDGALADDSDGAVSLELYSPVSEVLIPFDGPAITRIGGLYENMTTTSILTEDPVQTDYRIKVIDFVDPDSKAPPEIYPRTYSFIVEVVKSSDFETESNNDKISANPFDLITRSVSGQIDIDSDIDYFSLTDTDLNTLGIFDGDLVAVHVYAARDVDLKAYENTGFGSSLEPELTIEDNSNNIITTSTFVQDSDLKATSEGINAPYPTLTAVFVANSAIPAYFISIKNGGTYSNLDPSHAYLIEIERLGQ